MTWLFPLLLGVFCPNPTVHSGPDRTGQQVQTTCLPEGGQAPFDGVLLSPNLAARLQVLDDSHASIVQAAVTSTGAWHRARRGFELQLSELHHSEASLKARERCLEERQADYAEGVRLGTQQEQQRAGALQAAVTTLVWGIGATVVAAVATRALIEKL